MLLSNNIDICAILFDISGTYEYTLRRSTTIYVYRYERVIVCYTICSRVDIVL